MAFPLKLYHITTDPANQGLISWSPDGTVFTISNIPKFASEILPAFFQHSNYASFRRQLNAYGFTRVRQSESDNEFGEFESYHHRLFLRGQMHHLVSIDRSAHETIHEGLAPCSSDDVHQANSSVCTGNKDTLPCPTSTRTNPRRSARTATLDSLQSQPSTTHSSGSVRFKTQADLQRELVASDLRCTTLDARCSTLEAQVARLETLLQAQQAMAESLAHESKDQEEVLKSVVDSMHLLSNTFTSDNQEQACDSSDLDSLGVDDWADMTLDQWAGSYVAGDVCKPQAQHASMNQQRLDDSSYQQSSLERCDDKHEKATNPTSCPSHNEQMGDFFA